MVQGVYEIQILSRKIRIIVLSRLPLSQRNSVLAFFSFDPESVKFALENYKWHKNDGSTVINQLLEKYSLEGIAMPYTMEQLREYPVQKDYIKAHIGVLDPEEVLSKFKAEDIEFYLEKLKKKS